MDNLVKTSYSKDDVVVLLQDIKGKVPILDTEERERLNQSGIHYSEMLPLEYKPTEEYMRIYEDTLNLLSFETANAVSSLSDKIMNKKGEDVVIVSLARAGTPIGILVKRYIRYKYKVDVPHYSISIIRGKGIDKAAMNYIVDKEGVEGIQFIDGWVGKGAINKVLVDACKELENTDGKFKNIDSELAVLSDPASVTDLCGTTQDFLTPSACLNATVSGLFSRTVHIEGEMGDKDLHGAMYYGEYEKVDKSNEFIETVCTFFDKVKQGYFKEVNEDKNYKGLDEVKEIAKHFKIDDVNKIKPGVGETTRVLLRRVPERILIRKGVDKKYLEHIIRLCEEKRIPLEEYPLRKYSVCGVIREMTDL